MGPIGKRSNLAAKLMGPIGKCVIQNQNPLFNVEFGNPNGERGKNGELKTSEASLKLSILGDRGFTEYR